ncbi:MAG: hypothetical protein OXE99_08005, partial [Cellvibrionales bacterium]|nr:hypothetical protein [Cellvibrionales bacterium]
MKYPFSTSSYSAFIVVLAYLHNFCFGGVSSVEYPISCYTKKGCPTQKKSTLSIKSFKSIKSFCGRFVNLVTYPYAKRKFNLKKRKYCSESGNVTVEHQIYKQYSSEGGVARYSTKMDASKLNYLGQTDWDFNFSNMNKEWEKGFKESSSDESDFEGKTLSVFDSIESLPYAPSIDSLLFVPHCPGEKDGNVKQESTRCPEITRTGGSKPVTLESNIEPVTSKSSEPTFARDKKQRTESES